MDSLMTIPSGYLCRAEAARYLGLAPKTLANHASKGTGPRYSKPPNSHPRYRVTDLDSWLSGNDNAFQPREVKRGRPRKG